MSKRILPLAALEAAPPDVRLRSICVDYDRFKQPVAYTYFPISSGLWEQVTWTYFVETGRTAENHHGQARHATNLAIKAQGGRRGECWTTTDPMLGTVEFRFSHTY